VVPGSAGGLPTLYAGARTSNAALFPLRYDPAQQKVVPLPVLNTTNTIGDLATANLNGDGNNDLIVLDVADPARPTLHALFGPDFRTQVFNSAPLTRATSRLAVSDLFGDGYDKVVFVTQADAANSGVWVMGYQNGALVTALTKFATGSTPETFVV